LLGLAPDRTAIIQRRCTLRELQSVISFVASWPATVWAVLFASTFTIGISIWYYVKYELKPCSPNPTADFITAVREVAEQSRREEPYRIIQLQQEQREVARQEFLKAATDSNLFSSTQANFLWDRFGKRVY